MRFKLFLLFAIINVYVYADKKYDVRINGNSYTYTDTLLVSPSVAYSNAQNWILTSSTSYKGSVQYENIQQKKIIAKSGVLYDFNPSINMKYVIVFDLTIELKDGKFRVKLDNIKENSISDDHTAEFDIVAFALFTYDLKTGTLLHTRKEQYEKNELRLQELRGKITTAKKKEATQILQEIASLEAYQKGLEKDDEKCLKVNSKINNYIELLTKQLNTEDDF